MAGSFDQEVLINSGMVDVVSKGSKNAGQELFRFERVDRSEVGEKAVKSLRHVRCVCGVVEGVLWFVVLF